MVKPKKIKSTAARVKNSLAHPGTLTIPPAGSASSSAASSPNTAKTPRTPADEGIAFFESDIGSSEGPVRVYELPLEPDGGPSKNREYIRLPPALVPYILRVSLEAGTPASRNGVFKTNFPLDGGKFDRNRFSERRLPTDVSKPIEVDLPISHAGAFAYWVEYDGEAAGKRITGRQGYINIDPILRTRARAPILSSEAKPLGPKDGGAVLAEGDVHLPLSGVSILSTVNKWMGPVSKWPSFFAEARDRGYNMLHWTPLQERGQSGSPYSIKDQLRYEPSMFDDAKNLGSDGGVAKMEEILGVAREDYGLLSLTDVVLNHTADNSTWLEEHPEAGYSPLNFPHLTPALELDDAIIEFSGSLESRGLPTEVNSMGDVDALTNAFAEFIKPLNFYQFYVLDTQREKEGVKKALLASKTTKWAGPDVRGKSAVEVAEILRSFENGKLIDGLGKYAKRLGVHVDASIAAGIVQAVNPDASDSPDALADVWGKVVDVLNVPLYQEWEGDTKTALENIKGRLKYGRLDEHGPRLGKITSKSPIMESYFARVRGAEKEPLKYSLAVNGWMWDANPLANFAYLPSKAYFQRTIIAWGDCVKLNYGASREDSPFLWDHMTEYVTSLARAFTGFRLDNCHSTPLHVGTFLLDRAREVNPDLYVVAELFTGSEDTDTVFVSRLGINSLVREAGNAWDTKELSRIIWRDGLGKPIGSMDAACLSSTSWVAPPTTSGKGPIRPCLITPLSGSLPHALLYDQTHDNESTAMKRTPEDTLSTAAIVAFSWSATGSVKGFDEVYPKLLELVTEKRLYELVGLGEAKDGEFGRGGIALAKRVLNSLHREMVIGGYEEGHVHQENDYLVLHRVQPQTRKGYLLVAHTAFGSSRGSKDRGFIDPVKLRGSTAKFVFGASVEFTDAGAATPDLITGIPSKLIPLSPVTPHQGSDGEGAYSDIVVPDYFPPGSILIFETQLEGIDPELDAFCTSGAEDAFKDLDLVDLNVVIFRAEGEELDATKGEIGGYDIPGHGKLTYCGLEGWMHPLRKIMQSNDLGHPLCGHLREGTWALDYISSRLLKQASYLPALAKPAEWFRERFDRVKTAVPPYLRPKYFAIIMSEAYKAARRAVMEQCSDFVSSGHSFTQDLALVAVQMHGRVQSASLDPIKETPSLAAGLPHFAAGWARCWGRDVFISLRGLFLTTGNFASARQHILAFASTLKHGLIPNLLDSVRNPRYNSRDSPWWMLQNIQDYVLKAPDGLALLSEPVKRRFPTDDTWVPWDDPRAYAESSTIAEIIQEVLQRHADGISFREYNAGPSLDMQMRDEGFTIDIHVDWETGLIFGGNEWNCGTWMDKMGESQRAGTKGVPGTPRDGAPVEIIGLLKSTLRWLNELSSKGKFPFKGVQVAKGDGERRLVTYKEWNNLIQASFEKSFYVPLDPATDKDYSLDTKLVNRRGIYKDVFGSGKGREWSDYQFRSNFPIAMTVAPELFDPEHALGALKLADENLRAPLGMKTLDPADMQYRPYYDNANDSDDAAVAKGRNYHQGPEWGWPLGYFLRAYLHFDTKYGAGKKDSNVTLHHVLDLLRTPRAHIRGDPWAGLPELTNKDGAFCYDSCRTQAWSASTLLDLLEDVHGLSST
ncbi:glycoside hydrolase family 133 protein [Auriscalpium vulgare]|uniref:Glycoside hydrolase family 133 protein n=1 Tax=Auriscalpium vulgare TaxID=40419 RepID=A0ACB8RPK8_9AGAM|nr:glycoside hydrolase family 133 protein [Auriscalpium vulgare]